MESLERKRTEAEWTIGKQRITKIDFIMKKKYISFTSENLSLTSLISVGGFHPFTMYAKTNINSNNEKLIAMPLDTRPKLNIHRRFICHMNALWTFNLDCVSIGITSSLLCKYPDFCLFLYCRHNIIMLWHAFLNFELVRMQIRG